MKAAVIHQHGAPDQVRVEEIPDPSPGASEVLVRIHAAALNHLDLRVVHGGRAGMNLAMPHVIGSDGTGVVAAVGAGVRGISTGAEVMINPGLSCGVCEFCSRGEHSECVEFGIIGMSRPGTFAELVAVPASNVAAKPAHLSWPDAAALTLAHLTAWRMLATRGCVRPGETVLIHGIGGGVALAALQIARMLGASAIVTSSSNTKLERARALGAAHAINYREAPDIAARVRTLTGGRGVDLVVDTVGGATLPVNFAALRRGGRMVLCGVTAGSQADANLQALYWNQLTVLGSTLGSREDLRQLLAAVDTTGLKPVIDSVLPLDRAREALERMQAGEQFGKIVLNVV